MTARRFGQVRTPDNEKRRPSPPRRGLPCGRRPAPRCPPRIAPVGQACPVRFDSTVIAPPLDRLPRLVGPANDPWAPGEALPKGLDKTSAVARKDHAAAHQVAHGGER